MADTETNKTQIPASSAQLPTSSFSETTKRWSKWASTFFKKEKALGAEPWFNPEADTKQKREWIEQQQAQATQTATWPDHVYENFFVLGLPPDIEITQIAEQLCDLERKQRHHEADAELEQGREHMQPPQPSYAPQVLYRFPAGSPAPISDEEVAALAFPSGVTPEKLKRTPSLSGLDELIMGRDTDAHEQCFVFMLKVGGNFPLYGCCWYVREMLHRAPYMARQRYRNCQAPFRQCMIAAPRCYCLLSHYPFFELHFRVLKIILDLERLERLLEYDTEKSKLPPPAQIPGTGRSSVTGRVSSTDTPMVGQPWLQSAQSGQGPSTATTTGGPAMQHMPRSSIVDTQSCAPAVHNRQGYCNECAGIIEDMCPFTPGVSPVPGGPLQQRMRRQQQQQQQQPPNQQHSIVLVDQEVGCPQQNMLQQVSSQHPDQQPEQQQLPGLPSAQSWYCEVCGKPIGGVRSSAQVPDTSAMLISAAHAARTAATPVQSSRRVSADATQQATATGPLKAGVKQQQQVPTTVGFAQAKAWIASTAMQGTESERTNAWQSAFDAAAASGFDSAAAISAAGDHERVGAAAAASAAGKEQQNYWQGLASARQQTNDTQASSTRCSEDPDDEAVWTSEQESVYAHRETSLVQRMWDVWAPRPSAAASADVTPRQSGLVGFFKRVSRASSAQIPAQPEQQEMQPIRTRQQQGERHSPAEQQHKHTAEHSPVQQEQDLLSDHAAAAVAGVVQHHAIKHVTHAIKHVTNTDNAGSCIAAQGNGLGSGHSASRVVHYNVDWAVDNTTSCEPAADDTTSAAAVSAAAADWASDRNLQPLCSYKAINSSATSIHSNQHMDPAVKSMPKSTSSSACEDETSTDVKTPTAASAASASAALPPPPAAALTEIAHGQDAAAPAGVSGSAVVAARAVHRHSQSEASNASSFHSAVEHPEPGEDAAAAHGRLGADMQRQPLVSAAQADQRRGQPVLQVERQQQPQMANDAQHQYHQAASQKATLTAAGGLRSARQSSSDSELLVSTFTAIAAAATPHSAPPIDDSDAKKLNNSVQLAAVPAAVSADEGVQVEVHTAAAGVMAAPQSAIELDSNAQPERSSSCGAAESFQAVQDCWELQPTRSKSQPTTPLAGRSPSSATQHPLQSQQQCCAHELRDAMHQRPISRGSSVRRSLMFEDMALRRSGDLSAELCRTISHLVQVDSHSVLSAYHISPVPPPGDMYRLMLGDLYRLEFERALPLAEYRPPGKSRLQNEVLSYAEVESAQQLQLWTVAALCRSLSIENIITLLTAVLLEKQLVVFCPHIGTLAAVVLSLVPLLRPFAWQSLMLPVTPGSMLAFLEAPVPFVLGVQYKTPGVVSRCHGLIRVNVYKDGIKNASLPSLPGGRQLQQALTPHHTALKEAEDMAVERPVYVITPDEEAAAKNFLSVVHGYLSQLCGDLRLHTIVNVGMTKKTGVFMKDSFIESVPSKDRPFMKAFTETQMFAVYADGIISDYCES